MSELMRRAAPGLALAGAALATVWVFDPALHGQASTTAAQEPTPTTGEPTPAPEETTTDPSDCSTPTSVTGDAVMTRWGPVQVRMDFAADGTVCAVQAITYPDDDQRSAQINAWAIPELDAQATEVGVEFDFVSGATYTSEAYRESMQSILDQR
jgi:uncharacterized protein with FMN-binding domain